jgi:RNA polymerase sigma factor (sigma-70 family)
VECDAPAWPPDLLDVYTSARTHLVRTAFLICGSVAQAEDVVHDALLRVAAKWDAVENGRAYLFSAVVNGARDAARAAARLGAFEDGECVERCGDDSLALRAALLRLPERHRTAVVLRYFADWDDDEIARALSVRSATVRSWVHRAIKKLRTELGE